MKSKTVILSAIAGLGLAGLTSTALAANADAVVAAQYAKDAAKATTLEDVHKHMRMALNCLVGAGHEDYVAAVGGDCATTTGAIKTSDGMASVAYRLAAQIAKTAIALDTLGGAQFAARTAERLIETTDPDKIEGVDLVAGAQFITGTINAIDPVTRTVTMGADTYHVRAGTTELLTQFQPGNMVEVTYVVEDGRRVALDIRKVPEPLVR